MKINLPGLKPMTVIVVPAGFAVLTPVIYNMVGLSCIVEATIPKLLESLASSYDYYKMVAGDGDYEDIVSYSRYDDEDTYGSIFAAYARAF